jgi:hypothetical protein
MAALVLLLSGCSTAPVADLMDYYHPGRVEPAAYYYGGVGGPAHTVVGRPDTTALAVPADAARATPSPPPAFSLTPPGRAE